MKEKVTACLIGLGARGIFMLENVFVKLMEMGELDIVSVCDIYDDRMQEAADLIEKTTGRRPFMSSDYKKALSVRPQCVMITSAWESHIEIALYAMEHGIPVGTEVGGAYNLHDCFRLVDMYERTGVQCMMLENCCYGRRELMALNMARSGVFGQIVHCSGGYMHDLRSEIAEGIENRHYRQRNYLNRNCENYPTHELGPIAQVLDINHGNRLLYLTSVASCSAGMHRYVVDKRGENDALSVRNFAQGDIVTTTIKCARGETIVMTLDTTLPRTYSRGFTVRGTKGMYDGGADYIFLDGDKEVEISEMAGNAEALAEKYEHPMWAEYRKNPIGGHGGMDWLVYNGFLHFVREGGVPPLDTYDTATLMCISSLSENSVALGGAPQPIPDFTGGRWLTRTEDPVVSDNPYALR